MSDTLKTVANICYLCLGLRIGGYIAEFINSIPEKIDYKHSKSYLIKNKESDNITSILVDIPGNKYVINKHMQNDICIVWYIIYKPTCKIIAIIPNNLVNKEKNEYHIKSIEIMDNLLLKEIHNDNKIYLFSLNEDKHPEPIILTTDDDVPIVKYIKGKTISEFIIQDSITKTKTSLLLHYNKIEDCDDFYYMNGETKYPLELRFYSDMSYGYNITYIITLYSKYDNITYFYVKYNNGTEIMCSSNKKLITDKNLLDAFNMIVPYMESVSQLSMTSIYSEIHPALYDKKRDNLIKITNLCKEYIKSTIKH
jgi:hypothetical protein